MTTMTRNDDGEKLSGKAAAGWSKGIINKYGKGGRLDGCAENIIFPRERWRSIPAEAHNWCIYFLD